MTTRYLYIDGMFKDPLANEEQKVPLRKREQKVQDKFDDGKSDVSAFTTKTNKTANGALRRHCKPCGKLITNWTDHKKRLHSGNDVPYEKCVPNCPRCEGKCFFKFPFGPIGGTYRSTGRPIGGTYRSTGRPIGGTYRSTGRPIGPPADLSVHRQTYRSTGRPIGPPADLSVGPIGPPADLSVGPIASLLDINFFYR